MKKTNDAIRIYSERLQPQIRLFYRAAHAITGSRRLAECVLSNAALSAYLNRSDWRERMSFREGVLRALFSESCDQLSREPDADWDWTGIAPDMDGEHPLIDILATEPPEAQRTMILRYGCNLPAKEIGMLTGRLPEKVREQLSRCQVRAERELHARDVNFKPFERYAAKELRQWLNRENSEPIDVGYFLSTFEKDAAGTHQPRRVVAQVLRGIFAILGAVILAFGVWLIAILMEI